MVDLIFAGYALFNEYAAGMGNEGLRGGLIQIKERQRHPSHPKEGGREGCVNRKQNQMSK
jgi:hypothetical protein